MRLPFLQAQEPSLLWLEGHRIQAGTHQRPLAGLPTEDQLAQALAALPVGPTRWVVDDLWVPSAILRDLPELPRGTEAQEAFFRWRFNQTLALEEPHAVQALPLGAGAWLAAGIREDLRESWIQLSLRMERGMRALTPRWLHLYNQLAPGLDLPGMLLSLSPAGGDRFSGTLVAWGRTLCLVRQWAEPLSPDGWTEERLSPSAAFLQREAHTPQQLVVWGASSWPEGGVPVRCLGERVPAGEVH